MEPTNTTPAVPAPQVPPAPFVPPMPKVMPVSAPSFVPPVSSASVLPPAPAQSNVLKVLLIILGVVLILGGGAFYYFSKKSATSTSALVPAVRLTNVEQKTRSLVASFPKELILSKDAIIFQSYVQNGADNKATGGPFQIATAIYTTKDMMNTVYMAYLDFFKTGGYTLLRSDITADGSSTTMLAAKGAYSVSVVLASATTETKGIANTKVTISYGQLTNK